AERLVIKQRHERVPRRKHEKQKGKRHVHEQPGVQPMMQLCLKIEHPALVAPRLNFLDAAAVHFGHPKFYKAECIVTKAAVAEPKHFAAYCLEETNHLRL